MPKQAVQSSSVAIFPYCVIFRPRANIGILDNVDEAYQIGMIQQPKKRLLSLVHYTQSIDIFRS